MKIRFLITSIFSFLLLFTAAFAQDEDLDDLDFEDEPLEETRPPYFGIALGYTGNYKWITSDPLQNLLSPPDNSNKPDFDLDDVSQSFYLHGFSAFTAIPWIENLRLSFFTQWGGMQNENLINNDSLANTTRGITYNSNMTGGAIGYGFVLFDHFAIIPQVGLGLGNLDIEFYQTTDQNIDWNNIPPTTVRDNYTHKLHTNYFLIMPTVNIEYALTNYLMFRAAGGYSYTIGEDTNWSFNNSGSIDNIPEDLNSRGAFIQFGVFLGLFNY